MLWPYPMALALPFPEPVGSMGHQGDYFKDCTAEEVDVKSDHQNRLFYVEYHVFSPISMTLVTCRWSAELMHVGSDAEHHLGIKFIVFNKQRRAVGWQQV